MVKVVHVMLDRYDVYVGRENPKVPREHVTGWGNPFIVGRDGEAGECAIKYRAWLKAQPALIERAKRELAGKTLACWCAPRGGLKIDGVLRCHAQVLARAARGDYG